MNRKNKFIITISVISFALLLSLGFIFKPETLKVLWNDDYTCTRITYDVWTICQLESGCIIWKNPQKSWNSNWTRTCNWTWKTSQTTRSCDRQNTSYTNANQKNCTIIQKDLTSPDWKVQ